MNKSKSYHVGSGVGGGFFRRWVNPERVGTGVLKITGLFLALVFHLSIARADNFGGGVNEFTMDFVSIGNPGNGADPSTTDVFYPGSIGAVPYVYRMGVYEVSRQQVDAAVNLGLQHVEPLYGTGNKPVAGLSWYEAAAYVNWLNESTGHQKAYDLSWTGTRWNMDLWSPSQAWTLGGENLYRNKDAFYFLPSEHEWYKAAYHANDGVTANYYLYATGSNEEPIRISSGTDPGTAVTFGFGNPGPNAAADVNLAGGLSAYGTMGQTGNVFEYMETAEDGSNNGFNRFGAENLEEYRVTRGGNWVGYARSDFRSSGSPDDNHQNGLGMRVASVDTVPEPSVNALLLLGLGALVWVMRSRRHQCG